MDRRSALKILHLDTSASIHEIKQSYRKLAARYHPDHHAQNPVTAKKAGEKMKELNSAYAWLLDNGGQTDEAVHPAFDHQPSATTTFQRFSLPLLVFLALLVVVIGGFFFFTFSRVENQFEKENKERSTAHVETALFLPHELDNLSHSEIQKLQQGLTALGYEIGGVDGFMGPKTRAGIQAYCADFRVFKPCGSVAAAQNNVQLHATVITHQPEWLKIAQDGQFHTWLTDQEEAEHVHMAIAMMPALELVKLIDQYRFMTFAPSQQQLPTTGVLWQESKPLGSTILTLDAGKARGHHFYLKLIQATTKQDVVYGFVRGGDQWNIALPPGDHQLKIAVGDEWYGKQYLFGPETHILLLDLPGAKLPSLSQQPLDLNTLIQSNQITPTGSVFAF
ncbi:MAG: hypothetical protein CSB34_05405 [Desulfobulbus propionicus]|nr:MAG: hypothetical protein CSB34_05405 [Desulfobulbus propionicus]